MVRKQKGRPKKDKVIKAVPADLPPIIMGMSQLQFINAMQASNEVIKNFKPVSDRGVSFLKHEKDKSKAHKGYKPEE